MGHMEHGCYILHSRIRLVKSHFYGLSFQVPGRFCGRRLTGGTGVSWLQPGDRFSHSAAFFQQQRAEQLAAPRPPCLCRNACGREKNVLLPAPSCRRIAPQAWLLVLLLRWGLPGMQPLLLLFTLDGHLGSLPGEMLSIFRQWAGLITKNMQKIGLAEIRSLFCKHFQVLKLIEN